LVTIARGIGASTSALPIGASMSEVQVKSEEEAAEAAQPDATEEKTDRTIVTEHGSGENIKDDCSELTDNNVDNNEESCPRSFPRKVS
jgi:hypothetical protein